MDYYTVHHIVLSRVKDKEENLVHGHVCSYRIIKPWKEIGVWDNSQTSWKAHLKQPFYNLWPELFYPVTSCGPASFNGKELHCSSNGTSHCHIKMS